MGTRSLVLVRRRRRRVTGTGYGAGTIVAASDCSADEETPGPVPGGFLRCARVANP